MFELLLDLHRNSPIFEHSMEVEPGELRVRLIEIEHEVRQGVDHLLQRLVCAQPLFEQCKEVLAQRCQTLKEVAVRGEVEILLGSPVKIETGEVRPGLLRNL